jgi:hypothetical protein
MSEPIIQPAPASSSIEDETPPIVSTTNSSEQTERNSKIKFLEKDLMLLNNIVDPIQQLTTLEQHLSPQLRIIIRSNQLVTVALLAKAALKTSMDERYLDISDPPQSLKDKMETATASVDNLVKIYIDSMVEIINYIQNQHPDSEYVSRS